MSTQPSQGFTKPYIVRKLGEGSYGVYKETGGPRLGTHSSRESAERQIAAIHANEGKAMPDTNRTVKIFGFGNKPKLDTSRLEGYGGQGPSALTGAMIPSGQIGTIRMAITEISAAAQAVEHIIEAVHSDIDLNPAHIKQLIANIPPAQRMNPDLVALTKQLAGQLRDAQTAQMLASQLEGRVAGLGRTIRDIQAATGVKSLNVPLYIRLRSESAIKFLKPDPIMGKLITAVEALANAASVLQSAVDSSSIPQPIRQRLESSGLYLSGLIQGLNGAKARLASLHLFDNIGATADAASFWRKPGI